jgi:hypothetical protein
MDPIERLRQRSASGEAEADLAALDRVERGEPPPSPPPPLPRPADPQVAPLLARLAAIGGADDTRPEPDVLADLDATAAKLQEVTGGWKTEERAAAAAVELQRVKGAALAAPELLGKLRETIAVRRKLIGAAEDAEGAWKILDAAAIAAPLAPRHYPVKGFAMAPGPAALWLSFSFGGKSVILQDLCLSLATGTRVWGQWKCDPCKVLHMDYEQGHEETCDRYQRLARGRRIDLAADAAGRLNLVCRPPAFLNSPNAEEAFKKALDGYGFAFLDTFAAALPGVEENETKIGEYVYLLGRVSEATGCTIAVAHHMGKGALATKPQHGKEADLRTLARGSTAIFAAAGYAYALGGAKKEPKLVQQAKARGLGDPQVEDFYLELAPVDVREPDLERGWGGYRNPNNYADVGGFGVTYKTVEQIKPPKADKEEDLETDVAKVMEYIRSENGKSRGVATMTAPAKALKMRKADCLDAFRTLLGRKLIHGRAKRGSGLGDFWISNPLPMET